MPDEAKRPTDPVRPGTASSPAEAAIPSTILPTQATLSPRETAAGQQTALPVVPGHEILGELGRGGMGVVYKARHLKLDRLVALKMILTGAGSSPDALSRFEKEARTAARLQHPNIVQIHGVSVGRAQPFFSLEFVSGGSLAAALAGAPQPPRESAVLVETLARTMQHAHENGVIHRDLKPANVLLAGASEPGGTLVPKITDFGLAKQLDVEQGQTQSGAILGTPSYMAPEQARGDLQAIGPACDIHALGAILYECLTGRPPFNSASLLETLEMVRSQEPVPPSRLIAKCPRDLETICLKCLEKQPERRYASCADLAGDLRRFLNHEPIMARPVTAGERLRKWVRRRPAVAALTLSLLTVTVVGMVLVFSLWRIAEGRAEEERDARRAETRALDAETSARLSESQARGQEQLRRIEAEERLYLANMALAQREWLNGNVGRVEELLNECPLGLRRLEWHYLKRQMNNASSGFALHAPNTVWRIALAPDGKLAVSVCDRSIRVWDPDRTEEKRSEPISRRQGSSVRVAFRPGTRELAIADPNGGVRLIEAESGKRLGYCSGHWGGVTGLAFNGDGSLLATVGRDRTAKLWQVPTGRLLRTFTGHADAVLSVALSGDGKRLATGSTLEEGTIRVWDAEDGKQLLKVEAGKRIAFMGEIVALAFRPDGAHLAFGGLDGVVHILGTSDGQMSHALMGHTAEVRSLAYSPDGKKLASAGRDAVILVREAQTYRELSSLRGHISGVNGLAFDAAGNRLVSASEDGDARVWDLAGPAEYTTIASPGTNQWYLGVAVTADGEQFAAGRSDGPIHVWNRRGELTRTLDKSSDPARALVFARDGKRLASAGVAGDVRLWDVERGRLERVLEPPVGGEFHKKMHQAVGLRFLEGDRQIAWAAQDGRVRVWNVSDGARTRAWTSAHPFPVAPFLKEQNTLAIAFSEDGRRLATAGMNHRIRIWEVATGRERPPFDALSPVFAMAFSPDARALAFAEGNLEGAGTLRLLDLETGRVRVSFGRHANLTHELSFSADGRRLASLGQDRMVRVWDPGKGQELFRLQSRGKFDERVAFGPDGDRLLVTGWDGVRVLEAVPGREVLSFGRTPTDVRDLAYSPDGKLLVMPSHDRVVVRDAQTGKTHLVQPWDPIADRARPLEIRTLAFSVAFNPDGRSFAVGGGTPDTVGDLRIFDAQTGKTLHRLAEHTRAVRCLAYSPEGDRLASASLDGTVKVWDTRTYQVLLSVVRDKQRVSAVAFSPDGKKIASGGRDRVIRIWDATTGVVERELKGHARFIASLAFDPRGGSLASAGSELEQQGEVVVWDVATGKQRFTLDGGKGYIGSVSYSPDGRRIATGGLDRRVHLFDAASGARKYSLSGHYGEVIRAVFNPAGGTLASSSLDRSVRVWKLDPSQP